MTVESGNTLYSPEQIKPLDPNKIPQHIAIIPDGNRRWAKTQHFSTDMGHRKGADNLMHIVNACKELGIKTVTFYLFSTENWTRPQAEIQTLMWMLRKYLINERETLIQNGVKLNTIGDTDQLPTRVLNALNETLEATSHCIEIDVVFALNYGARDEIRRAVTRIAEDCEKQRLDSKDINEETISSYLDTNRWPDPELLIRTSGEMRVSNYLLWQISYTEIFVSQAYWPEFTEKHLLEAVLDYQHRERRLGV